MEAAILGWEAFSPERFWSPLTEGNESRARGSAPYLASKGDSAITSDGVGWCPIVWLRRTSGFLLSLGLALLS
jgi:hypothetical protein